MTTAAIIIGLRKGQGVEDIAIDLAMTPEQVREVVTDLRARGVLPAVYEQARKEWRSIGQIAQKLVEQVRVRDE